MNDVTPYYQPDPFDTTDNDILEELLGEDRPRTSPVRVHPRTFASLARELALPLADMLGDLDRLAGGRLGRQQSAHVRAAQTSANVLLGLLHDLPELPDLESGRVPADLSILKLKDTVAAVLNGLAPLAERKGVALDLSVESAIAGRVVSDPIRLRKLLRALIDLGIRCAGPGDLTVAVFEERETHGGPRTRFVVTHNGRGIPEADLAVLRADGSAERLLADDAEERSVTWRACAATARAMGGGVGVESDGNAGFALWFAVKLHRPGVTCDERRTGRVMQEMLVSNLGPVIDVSMTGMRLLARRPRRGRLGVKIRDLDTRLKIRGQVMWTRPIDRKHHEMGLRFVDVEHAQLAQLQQIAARHEMDD